MGERVVVITSSYPREEGDAAGHFVEAQARGMARAGAEVHVIAPVGPVDDRVIERGGVRVYPAGGEWLFGTPGAAVKARQNPLRLAGLFDLWSGVRRRLGEIGEIDRAVAHWIVPGAWPFALDVSAPVEVVAHGADVRLLVAMPRPTRVRLLRILLGRGMRFQMVATELLETLAAVLPEDLEDQLRAVSRVEPAPIEVPDVAERARELRAGLRLADGEVLAVSVGRLIAGKRVHLAIEAAARASSGPERRCVHLVIVGDGPERARLQSRAAALGARVTWTGSLMRREALAWIAAADMLVHTSATEGAPTVVREARALGVPVVACAAGDLVRWAAVDPGIEITPPDAPTIAKAILRTAR